MSKADAVKNVVEEVLENVGKTAKKMGGDVFDEKGFKEIQRKKWLVKTVPRDERGLMEEIFPFRFGPVGAGVAILGPAAYGAFTLGANESTSRRFEHIEAISLPNIVGQTPLTVDAEVVRQIPNKLRTHGANKVLNAIPGVQGRMIDDMGAGGDLVFAMHQLR